MILLYLGMKIKETIFLLVQNSFFFSVKNHNKFSSQNIIISSQNNVPKYHNKGHEQRVVHVVLVSLFGRPIVRSISYLFGQPQKIVQSQRRDNFLFVHSLEFLVQSFWKIGYPLIRDWTIFFLADKKK